METQTVIYGFSATGNSLHAARLIASKLPGAVVRPMTGPLPSEPVGGPVQRVGFVFPVYFGQLPRLVKTFVESLSLAPDTFCFAVVTMGGAGAGAIAVLDDLLRAKGRALSYGEAVRMSGNYIMGYDPGRVRRSAKHDEKTDKKLAALARDIQAGRSNRVRRLKFTFDTLYKDVPALDRAFAVTDACSGCGTCEKLCPVSNIALTGGRPVWQGRCEHCTACINWCPQSAVQYGGKTAGRTRYHHPDVCLADMLAGELRPKKAAPDERAAPAGP
jgi:NAD-dependent dihydropyrimidine dehydrogenase PreA subunit